MPIFLWDFSHRHATLPSVSILERHGLGIWSDGLNLDAWANTRRMLVPDEMRMSRQEIKRLEACSRVFTACFADDDDDDDDDKRRERNVDE